MKKDLKSGLKKYVLKILILNTLEDISFSFVFQISSLKKKLANSHFYGNEPKNAPCNGLSKFRTIGRAFLPFVRWTILMLMDFTLKNRDMRTSFRSHHQKILGQKYKLCFFLTIQIAHCIFSEIDGSELGYKVLMLPLFQWTVVTSWSFL